MKKLYLLLFGIGTLLNAQTVFYENFEGETLPEGWAFISTLEDPFYTWTFYDNYDDIEIAESETTAQDEWVITPSIDLSEYSEMYLTFSPWMYVPVQAYQVDTFDVELKISTDGGSTWETIWEQDEILSSFFLSNWFYDRTITLSLNEYCGPGMDNVKIGFHYTSIGQDNPLGDYSGFYIVDVKVSNDCPETTFSQITTNEVHWFPLPEDFAGTFDIAYGPVGFDIPDGTIVTGLTGYGYTFPEPMTENFDIYIRTNCGGSDFTEWNKIFVNIGNLTTGEITSQNQINIYPNPTNGILYFSKQVSDVKVFDLSGKLVKTFNAALNKIDISGLLKGNYIVYVTDENGNRVSQKIIRK